MAPGDRPVDLPYRPVDLYRTRDVERPGPGLRVERPGGRIT